MVKVTRFYKEKENQDNWERTWKIATETVHMSMLHRATTSHSRKNISRMQRQRQGCYANWEHLLPNA